MKRNVCTYIQARTVGCSCTFTLLSPRPAAQLKSHAIELPQWVWYVSTSLAAIFDLLSSGFLLPHTNQYRVLKSPCKKSETTETSFLLLQQQICGHSVEQTQNEKEKTVQKSKNRAISQFQRWGKKSEKKSREKGLKERRYTEDR